MDEQLSFLFKKIKDQRISCEDAAEQLKLFVVNHAQGKVQSSILKNESDSITEVYAYDEPYLKDHTVYGEQVLIGVTHGSLAMNAFFKIFPQESSVHLHRLSFVKPIEVKKNQQVEVKVEPVQKESIIDFQVMYRYSSIGKWELTATGNLRKTFFESKKIDIESVRKSLEEYNDLDQIYDSNSVVGLGNSFKTVTHLYTGADQVLARVALHLNMEEEEHAYDLHPLISNSVFLAVGPMLKQVDNEEGFLPFGIKDVYFRKTNKLHHCWLHIKLVKNSGEMVIFDADVIDDELQVVAHYSGCSIKRLRSIGQKSGFTEQQIRGNLYHSEPIENTTDLPSKIQNYLMDKLRKILPNISKLSNLEVNLMDLGLESSQLVALTSEIEKETKIELNPTLFFEYPNIKELTEYFSQEHQGLFAQLLGITSKQSKEHKNRQSEKINSPRDTQEVVHHSHINLHTPVPDASIEQFNDDIAVIGMSGRFPEASTFDQLWNNIRDNKDLMKEIPIDHWDYRPWYDEDPEAKNKTYCKWGSFIEDVDKFDAGFFNISPREAIWMDPQLRLLLQSIYTTGEDAGYINKLRGTNTGVFVGVCFHDYMDKIAEMNLPVDPYIGTGNAQTVIANRISFLFNFNGPSIAIDTACSSSLIALHYASNALRNKECDMAFVGGVNLLLSSFHYRYFSSVGALSPTGRCHSFDEAADGYAPGESIASILLKPLQQAEKDGDHIYAIIKGSAALHGGYTPSLTAPSVSGEENVILKAWDDARIHPETLSYIEAHGTGTKLGDPIEVNSLNKAFKHFTKKEQFCVIGSVKANMGHAEGAAGIVGVLKVILQMKHKKIPVMPNFKKLNPYIKLDKSALYINQELEEWKSPAGVPRRAGINSFGFSGAYAHVVIEEYINKKFERSQVMINTANPAIIVISAKNEDRLKEQVRQLVVAIEENQLSDESLVDMAYTLQVGREAMEERLAVTAGSMQELIEKLNGFMEEHNNEDLFRGTARNDGLLNLVSPNKEDIYSLMQRKEYVKILKHWVKGIPVDWSKLYSAAKPRCISLPTYPFAKERYWLDSSKVQGSQKDLSAQFPGGEKEYVSNYKIPIKENVEDYIVNFLSQELDYEREQIELEKSIQDYGFDSITIMRFMRDFEKQFHIKVLGSEILTCKTIQALSNHLVVKIEELNNQGNIPITELAAKSQKVSEQMEFRGMDALEKFRQGTLTLEEIEELIDKGEII
jgi:acyl transferase domain-containing protein